MSSSSAHQAGSGLRGQPREEQVFYDEFIRVVGDSDVEQAVKDQINAEYSADRVGFAKRLLENTPAAMAGSEAASRRTSMQTFSRALRKIALWLLVAFLIVLLFGYVALVIDNQNSVFDNVLAIACVVILVVIVLAKRNGRLSRSSISRLNDVQDDEAQYRDVARVQLTEYLNIVANTFHQDSIAREEEARRLAAEESAEVVLSTTDARRLVELDDQDPVRVKALTDLEEFISLHVTSAIGISGPRGIGKTTIMRLLCTRNQDHYVGVYVPAPVRYSPADFVKTIHQRMAERILEAHGAARHDSSLLARPSAVHTVRFIVAVAVLCCVSAVLLVGRNFLQGVGWPEATAWGLAVVAITLLIFAPVSYYRTSRVQRRRDKNPVALARAELERLAWSTKTQTSSKNAFAFKALSHEDSSMTELVEREVSHMQQVDAFQKFAALYRGVSHRTIIVAIDELDKIATPDEAIDVVNGLKDLMHSEYIHFLVSVSEDALARFALRGIPLRDAFDSTFDTITEVDRFSAEDAGTLLERRVVGMPQVLAYYCHALSGGIPRDLIRLCRKCVDFSRHAGTGPPTSAVVAGTAKEHVTGLLNGATIRAKEQGPDFLRPLLEVRDAVNGSSADSLFELLDRASAFLWAEPQPDSPSALAPPLPVVLAVISTAGHYFGRKWTVASWRAEAQCGRAQWMANGVAGCMADAGVDTSVALEHLAALRKGLQLAPLAMDVLR
jgi:Cdc6-like AAA superfamily ATPase